MTWAPVCLQRRWLKSLIASREMFKVTTSTLERSCICYKTCLVHFRDMFPLFTANLLAIFISISSGNRLEPWPGNSKVGWGGYFNKKYLKRWHVNASCCKSAPGSTVVTKNQISSGKRQTLNLTTMRGCVGRLFTERKEFISNMIKWMICEITQFWALVLTRAIRKTVNYECLVVIRSQMRCWAAL